MADLLAMVSAICVISLWVPLRSLLGWGGWYLGASPGGCEACEVAIKVIHPRFANDPEYRLRSAREEAAVQQVGGFHRAGQE